MRKILVLLVVVLIVALLLGTVAMGEIDLSGMSYDELVELRGRIDKAIVDNGEYKEVNLPQGTYTFGEDIPAGKWTFTHVGDKHDVELHIKYIDEKKYSGDYFRLGTDEACNVEFVDGDTIAVEWDAVTIKPFKGIEF